MLHLFRGFVGQLLPKRDQQTTKVLIDRDETVGFRENDLIATNSTDLQSALRCHPLLAHA